MKTKQKEKISRKIVVTSINYLVNDGNFYIEASVYNNGLVTLSRPDGLKSFIFEESKPETVKAIAKLFISAANQADKLMEALK